MKIDLVKMEPSSSPSSCTSMRAQDIWISEPDDFNTYFMTDVDSQPSSGKFIVTLTFILYPVIWYFAILYETGDWFWIVELELVTRFLLQVVSQL